MQLVTVDVARQVMREVPGGDPDFEPWVWFHTFGASSIDFTVFLRAAEFAQQYPIRHEFVKRLQARYRREGIEIPFPIHTVRWEGNGHPGALRPGHLMAPPNSGGLPGPGADTEIRLP